ncbi:MAG: prepilin peptidase [Candidatus Bathyarchaeota archaeon]|nr:MAG: prepilin peptidase [Candidatus Bathyarchaeota archaeon]
MNEYFDGTRVLLCLIFFIYASWSDLKNREVSNKVWAVLAPLAFALTFSQFVLFAPEMLQNYAFSFAVTSAVSVALFYAGAFGGADAKALICLSLALPYPIRLLQPIGFTPPLFPITVFSNAILLAASTVFYAITRNLIWRNRTGKRLFEDFEEHSTIRKILALLCGYKINIEELESRKHSYPLEDIQVVETGETTRKLLVFSRDEKKEEIVGRILEAREEGKLGSEVWITPGLPLLVFITAGLIIALTLGDIVWIVLGSIL